MKKTLIAVSFVLGFVMAIATPILAQSMIHITDYRMDGDIWMNKQVGHICNTGAELKQTIRGQGEMIKAMDTGQVIGRIDVDDMNNFVTAEDAVQNLTVTSVIELCAPPKYIYEDAVVSPLAMYDTLDQPYTFYGDDFGGSGHYSDEDPLYDEWTPLTPQIWAVQVSADPGFSGNLHQDFTATYGPYETGDAYDEDDDWNLSTDAWGWDGEDPAVGVNYVGNYFDISQHARTSQGTLQRLIHISSPWNHGYLHEDMSVIGASSITEAFTMSNLPEGADIVTDWWVLF